MRPVGVSRRGGRGVALEQRVLGLGVERRGRLVEHQQQRLVAHEAAGQRELLPLAERHVHAARPRRPELRVEPRRQPRHHVVGAGAIDGARAPRARRRGAARRRGRPCAARETRSGRNPETRPPAARATRRRACAPAACRRRGSRPDDGSYILREQLDQRGLARAVLADDGDDRAGRQRAATRRRARAARCLDTRTTRGRGGCRCCSASGTGRSAVAASDARSPRARPAAASRPSRSRAESRSRRRSRRCTPTAARRPRAPAARRRRTRRSTTRRSTTAPTYARAEHGPRQRVPRRRAPARRATGPYQRSQASRRSATSRSPMPVTRTSLPGGAVVAVVKRCRASRVDCAPRSCAVRSTPGRHVDVNTVGSAKTASSTSAG